MSEEKIKELIEELQGLTKYQNRMQDLESTLSLAVDELGLGSLTLRKLHEVVQKHVEELEGFN